MEDHLNHFVREDKNPARRRTCWEKVSPYFLPIIASCLLLFLFLQFYWLSKVSVVAQKPDGIATIDTDLPDVTLINEWTSKRMALIKWNEKNDKTVHEDHAKQAITPSLSSRLTTGYRSCLHEKHDNMASSEEKRSMLIFLINRTI